VEARLRSELDTLKGLSQEQRIQAAEWLTAARNASRMFLTREMRASGPKKKRKRADSPPPSSCSSASSSSSASALSSADFACFAQPPMGSTAKCGHQAALEAMLAAERTLRAEGIAALKAQVQSLEVSASVGHTRATVLCCAVLRCAVLCCAVLCCAVLCCAVLCCAVLCCAVLCCAFLRCAVLFRAVL